MNIPTDDSDVVRRSDLLDTQLIARDAFVYGLTNRHYIRMLAVVLMFDLFLTMGFILNYARITHNSHVAANQTRTLCQASNGARALNLQLWTYILSITPPPTTPARAQEVANFRKYLDTSFAQRQCP